MLVLYARKQVRTKHSEGQRSTQRLFHSWPNSLWLTPVLYTFSALSKGSPTARTGEDPLFYFPPVSLEVSVRGVFCSTAEKEMSGMFQTSLSRTAWALQNCWERD